MPDTMSWQAPPAIIELSSPQGMPAMPALRMAKRVVRHSNGTLRIEGTSRYDLEMSWAHNGIRPQDFAELAPLIWQWLYSHLWLYSHAAEAFKTLFPEYPEQVEDQLVQAARERFVREQT